MAATVGRIYAARLFELEALMLSSWRAFWVVVVLSTSCGANACGVWPSMPYAALRMLEACDEPAVERQVGQLCLHHEWRCGTTRFKDWFDQWMAELDEPVAMQKRLGQVIFSGVDRDTSWAVFWAPSDEDEKGFVVLISRLRATPVKEK